MAANLQLDDIGVHTTCGHCGKTNRVAFGKLGHEARCGECKEPLAPGSAPLEVRTTADFDRLISLSAVPVVVDFWAPWCGPCRMVAPELEKVARRSNGRFLIVKVNTDVLDDLGARYTIRSIPTMAVFANGREVQRAAGARPASDIETFIAGAVA